MADLHFGYGPDEADASYIDSAPAEATGRTSRVVQGAGAAVSLALIAGRGWWGWQLLVRDVSGVPVVRALAGPSFSRPNTDKLSPGRKT